MANKATIAIIERNLSGLDKALQREDINATTSFGCTPLHFSIGTTPSLKQMSEELLRKGANPNKQDKDGKTPLHYAYECGNIELANQLEQHGANPNIIDKNGKKPAELSRYMRLFCRKKPVIKRRSTQIIPIPISIWTNCSNIIGIFL